MHATVRSWIIFISVVLILLGTYGLLRTVINTLVFEKYPTSGVIHLEILSQAPTYNARESDCYYYPQAQPPSYDSNGNPIFPQEDPNTKLQQENCIKGQAEDRYFAKVNDISKSALFLFLGIGLLLSLKYFKTT